MGLDCRHDGSDAILDKAKAECAFSDRLYEILFEYQERYHDRKRKPLKESGRVGELNLELSRLYNEIWATALEMGTRKKKQQQEVINHV